MANPASAAADSLRPAKLDIFLCSSFSASFCAFILFAHFSMSCNNTVLDATFHFYLQNFSPQTLQNTIIAQSVKAKTYDMLSLISEDFVDFFYLHNSFLSF